MNVVGVLGYEPESTKNVSGYALLEPEAENCGLPYRPFLRINDPETARQVREWEPDLLFVVGLSQLVGGSVLEIPKKGVIGFHPTALPRARGRAPIAWAVLGEEEVGASFFLMDSGVDSGPILEQELFAVEEHDYAEDIERKILDAIYVALDRLLPKLKQGVIAAQPQNEDLATYYGRRTPDDGCIDWEKPSEEIYRLIRASSRPHPGAFTFKEDSRVVIWKAKPEAGIKYTGVSGRIVMTNEAGHLLVQTGNGLIWITEYEVVDHENSRTDETLKVGQRLGYNADLELYRLKREINDLKKALQ